ncbi:hypothetical protein Patl1_30941 [Pistacia atlantica]|uniref:Uncharacterized protein n=1 Tax=Pistacia atlantica TaxID=434234 RepID=A0ACC1ADW5_9ROSI|nr:hypothetical protein Patl1_30941 [Pistacia atlantica]
MLKVAFLGFITCTMFLRTRLHPTDEENGGLYLSCLFFGMVQMMFNGFFELPMTISRLPVFYKQRDHFFHPAWAWSFANWILGVPFSIIETVVWSCVVYYTVGFIPAAGRFFRYMLLIFSTHQMALSLYRMMAAIARDIEKIEPWCSWAFWVSPLSYGQRAFSVNEFSATRWKEKSAIEDNSVGYNVLHLHSLPDDDHWYWVGVEALLLYAFLFNNILTMALAYLHPLRKAPTIIPLDATEENSDREDLASKKLELNTRSAEESFKKKGMILPFQPLIMSFHNVNYSVDMPKFGSGAGKTTLMDVLAGRKTGGYIEGDIRISGYPKEQRTFARISGYVEQNDIHSPQVTVEESLWFSSCLRLPKEVSKDQRNVFVKEVMRLVELDSLRHALVGLSDSSGLSTEQRKRLTIAVELVANPSIIFMDEPTSGLDARAAAIVMRTVRNTVDTGRTVVCTIHQPSIDIFEAFDEIAAAYETRGGVRGVAPIPCGYNPATWMLEVTPPAVEEKIGVDFADVYKNSEQYRTIEFFYIFTRSAFPMLDLSLEQNLVYWRSPEYNAVRVAFTMVAALVFGSIFWDVGSHRDTTKDLLMVMGALYAASLFLGVNSASSVQPIVSIERTVFYRERAAGMYSPFAYAVAQGVVEIPYIAVQTIVYGVITYYMLILKELPVRFQIPGKLFLYLVFMFLTFAYFTFYGMMAVGLTPNQNLAAVNIPGWWIWFYYMYPVAWTLQGIITSQLGDVETMIVFKALLKNMWKLNEKAQSESDHQSSGTTNFVCLQESSRCLWFTR